MYFANNFLQMRFVYICVNLYKIGRHYCKIATLIITNCLDKTATHFLAKIKKSFKIKCLSVKIADFVNSKPYV